MFERSLARQVAALCVAAALAVPAAVGSVAAEEVSGAAIVIDGDTLVVDGQRVDLFGLDAPEPEQICEADGKVWNCGEDAARVLKRIIAGRLVSCALHGTAPSGAARGICRIGFEGLNREMAAAGMAIGPPEGPTIYAAEEAAAKAYPRGLWASRFTAPWDWRAGKRLVPPPGGG